MIGYSFDDLKEYIKENGIKAFGSVSKSDLLDMFLRGGSSDFINYQTGKCSFESQDFKDILEICNGGIGKAVKIIQNRVEIYVDEKR